MNQIEDLDRIASGDDAVRVTPVPIPNTKVKSYRADGTAGETLWESRKLPDFLWFTSSVGRAED